MTTYEYARAVTTRGNQIDDGSWVSIPSTSTDSLIIPRQELLKNKCPLYIDSPSGSRKGIESWHTSELEIIDMGLSEMPPTPIELIRSMSLEQMVGLHVVWTKITQPQPAKEVESASKNKMSSRKRESSARRSLVTIPEEITTPSIKGSTTRKGISEQKEKISVKKAPVSKVLPPKTIKKKPVSKDSNESSDSGGGLPPKTIKKKPVSKDSNESSDSGGGLPSKTLSSKTPPKIIKEKIS